jgi:hypothetical protein
MAQTFDTSRVGGGTYELEQDSSGNYKLKSVGFAQVNKLNLPDLKTSDTTTTTPKTEEKKTDVADPFKKLAAQNTSSGGGGGGSNQDYSGVMLKTPEVKDVSVRSAGDAMTANAQSTRQNFNQSVKDLQDKSTIEMNEAQIAKLNAEGASPQIMAQAQARLDKAKANEYDMYRTGVSGKPTGNFYQDAITRGQTGVKYQTPISPVSKATSAVQDTVSGVIDSVKNNKAIQFASNALGFAMNPIMGGIKMVASMLPEETAVQKVNKGYFNTNEGGQRISGNPATDLYAGMNRNSAFGNLENAGNKRISNRTKTIERRGVKSDSNPKGVSQDFVDNTNKMKDQARSYKQTKETATDTSPGATGGEGGNNSSDSGRVICTDLHRTGELSTKDWVRDTKFTFKTLSKTHVKGYLLWAEPTVKHMQKYPRYRKMWKHIAQHRANDIAWRLNEGKFDLLGRIYAGIGEPVCWALGNFVSDKQISKYNLTHWRRA